MFLFLEVDKAELCKPKFVRDYEKKKEKEEAKEKKVSTLLHLNSCNIFNLMFSFSVVFSFLN